jgi:hypothetical protein
MSLRVRGRIPWLPVDVEAVRQPATPPAFSPARPRPNAGVRAAKRGWALVRAMLLVSFTGFLVASVIATIFAGLVIAINGKLP